MQEAVTLALLSLCPSKSQCGQFFFFKLLHLERVKESWNQESRKGLKVQGACSALRDEDRKEFFSTLHVDGYHVIKQHFLQDKLTFLSVIVQLFCLILAIFKCAERPSQNGPDVLHYIVLYYNISETAKRSKKEICDISLTC